MEPVRGDHNWISRALNEHPAGRGLVFNGLVTALEIGGAIALFHMVRSMGGGDVMAYLIGSLAPLVGALVIWVRSRKFSGASVAIFALTVLSGVVALVSGTDSRMLLYKDCILTVLIGLVFGLSCVLMPRPLIFYISQRYGTDGTRQGMTAFDAMWDTYPHFRRRMYQISVVWMMVFLIQAAATALIIASTNFGTAYNYDQILPVVSVVVAVVLTTVINRRGQHEGAARPITEQTGQ